MNPRARDILILTATVLAAFWVWAWYTKPDQIPPGLTVEAPPAPEIAKEPPTVTLKPPRVRAYHSGVKGKLKLPASVQADDNQHVITSTIIEPDERPHTVTTVMDATTGEVTSYNRTDPLPWLAVNTKTEIGLYYGLKQGQQVIRLEGRQELLQIKAMHAGAVASADMSRGNADGFIGVGVWARF